MVLDLANETSPESDVVGWQLRVVIALGWACTLIDWLAYRPAVVKLGTYVPRWWCCDLARLSMRLDDRWATGYWESPNAPPAPLSPCDACGRRGGWLVVGGSDEGKCSHDYLAQHPVVLCGWCRPEFPEAPRTRDDVTRSLREAGERSISWAWN